MIGRYFKKMDKAYIKTRSSRGMTMAEMLVTVAIIGILMGVGFIAVVNYQRSLAQLERDGVAKEIFIAAQNHLTMARGEGYYQQTGTDFGTQEQREGEGSGVYYYVVNSENHVEDNETSVLNMMLPFGSIDETVRSGGSYIVRYDPDSAKILDVFYTTTGDKFGHELTAAEYGADFLTNYRDDAAGSKKEARQRIGDSGWILGWYGGTAPGVDLKPGNISNDLKLVVHNSHTLYLEVSDYNQKNCYVTIKGVTSGAKKRILLSDSSSDARLLQKKDETDNAGNKYNLYEYVIDDITDSELHFCTLQADAPNAEGKGFKPGEDLEIQAAAYDGSENTTSNIIYSDIKTVNSLYGSITEEKPTERLGDNIFKASVYTIRHLENLEERISHSEYTFTTVFQTGPIDLKDFEDPSSKTKVPKSITGAGDTASFNVKDYFPVNYDTPLLYDGLGNTVSNIKVSTCNTDVNEKNYAGLFGAPASGSKFKNLELIDFDLSTANDADYAGTLAGALDGSYVNNVIAHNDVESGNDSKDKVTIKASEAAGGLVGLMNGGSIRYSAAALVVGDSGTASAGGLIGQAAGGSSVVACYSGGHTDNGEYYQHGNDGSRGDPIYNIKASENAGGLIGAASGNTTVSKCYSTCSVDGLGVRGGLIGDASAASIDNCYSTGLVSGEYAFIGTDCKGCSDSFYYQSINEKTDETNEFAGEYKAPMPGNNIPETSVKAFDKDVTEFNGFSGDDSIWRDAEPYDAELEKHYNKKYCLKGATQLAAIGSAFEDDADPALGTGYSVNTHYGDWPAPEVFIVNAN